MVRKCLLVGLALVLLVSLAGTIGCGNTSISGSFVCTNATDNFEEDIILELRTDRTAYWHTPNAPTVGASMKFLKMK